MMTPMKGLLCSYSDVKSSYCTLTKIGLTSPHQPAAAFQANLLQSYHLRYNLISTFLTTISKSLVGLAFDFLSSSISKPLFVPFIILCSIQAYWDLPANKHTFYRIVFPFQRWILMHFFITQSQLPTFNSPIISNSCILPLVLPHLSLAFPQNLPLIIYKDWGMNKIFDPLLNLNYLDFEFYVFKSKAQK